MAHTHRGALRAVGLGMTVTAFAVSSATGAQTPAQLDSAFFALQEAADIVGMSAAVLRDGTVAWTGTFGVRQSGLSARVDRNTVFEAASLTEPVVAYAILRLVDRGVIDLDRPIAGILANERLARDARYTRVTPRMVLSHASGIVDGHGRGGADDTLAIAFDPGTSWGYSAEALIWLEKAIERKTGQRLTAFVRREVLEPLRPKRAT